MTVATTALLVVILAGLLPNGFLRPQGAMAEVPVVPLKPDCGTVVGVNGSATRNYRGRAEQTIHRRRTLVEPLLGAKPRWQAAREEADDQGGRNKRH